MRTAIERIGSQDLELEVLPDLGARLHRLRAFGQDLLRTPDDLAAYAREPFFWGGFVMAPWCNRVAAGPQQVGDVTVELASNFPDGTAIHGQVQALPWEVTSPGSFRVVAGGAGWPWPYEVTMALRAEMRTMRVALALKNHSAEPMPAGLGFHPWFLRSFEIAIPAERVFATNLASSGPPQPISGALDLRNLGEMPPGLDATWTGLRGESIQLRWPTLGIRADMRPSPEGGYVCAASPDAFGAVAVEPQTHAPDGLRRLLHREPGAMTWLAPGASLRLQAELDFWRE